TVNTITQKQHEQQNPAERTIVGIILLPTSLTPPFPRLRLPPLAFVSQEQRRHVQRRLWSNNNNKNIQQRNTAGCFGWWKF
ncbi:unnamed protein product, partial [Ceratitis capitata]